jgi:hypothetical protein
MTMSPWKRQARGSARATLQRDGRMAPRARRENEQEGPCPVASSEPSSAEPATTHSVRARPGVGPTRAR